MSIVRSLRRREPERADIPWQSFGPWAYAVQHGMTIAGDPTTALRNAAAAACINLIVDGVTRTPVDAVRYVGDARQAVTPTPRLIADPNPGLVTARGWKSQVAWSLATHANAFGIVTASTSQGLPLEIQLVDPYSIDPQVEGGRKWIGIKGEWDTTWEHGGKWWHVPGKTLRPGSPYGLSPLAEAQRTIGLGLAAEDFSNEFFSGSGHPTWGFTADTALTKDQADAIKAAVTQAMRPGTREPLVFGSGLKAQQFSVNPGETQFIDTMRFVCEQVARFWGVPASAIGAAMSGQSVTYANVTDADLRTLKDVLIGYFVAVEDGLTPCLPRPQVVKFNQDAVLRGDPKLRTEIITAQIQAGLLSVNEGRKLLDLEPWAEPEYDQPFAHTPDPVAQDPNQGMSNVDAAN